MLKATGIIRHVDELGRIVVPKELRNTLKIKNGTSLEIYTNEQNELILKKYSPTEGIRDFADNLADTLRKVYSVGVLIADNDGFISGSERYLSSSGLNEAMCGLIGKRRMSHVRESCEKYLPAKREISEFLVNPIIVRGDLLGAVVVVAENRGDIGDEILKMTQAAVCLIEGQYS